MRKTMKHPTRFAVGLALAVMVCSGTAQAIQFPNDLFIKATGCTSTTTAVYTGALATACGAVVIPCTGTWQCPGFLDTKYEVVGGTGKATMGVADPKAVYKYLAATDGAALMGDGSSQYTFGFLDLTNVPLSYITGTVPVATQAPAAVSGITETLPVTVPPTTSVLLPPPDAAGNQYYQGKARWPAPDMVFKEGDHVYLNLIDLGMAERADLGDAHTIHWHGKDQAAPVFDGEPMASYGINMSLMPVPVPATGMPNSPEARDMTYYYNANRPGTYLYHCHVQATEHMEMGMLGNLIVRPAQDGSSHTFNGRAYTKFAYNDCAAGLATTLCGATGYDVELMLMLADFDPAIHGWDAGFGMAAPNFGAFLGRFPMMNGRGYPDTIRPDNDPTLINLMTKIGFLGTATQPTGTDYVSQMKSSLITINQTGGQRKALVRLTDLSIQSAYSLRSEVPFTVVGKDSALLAGPTGTDLTFGANDIYIGPGETYDFIIDVTGVPKGTYFLYSRQLNNLNDNALDRGGMMTEIIIN